MSESQLTEYLMSLGVQLNVLETLVVHVIVAQLAQEDDPREALKTIIEEYGKPLALPPNKDLNPAELDHYCAEFEGHLEKILDTIKKALVRVLDEQ